MSTDSRRHRLRRVTVRARCVGVCAAAVALVACGGGDPDAELGPTSVADPQESITWDLLWSDEFEATSLDGATWQAYHNTYGDGNDELACLTPHNVTVSEGSLRIEARSESVTCPSGETRRYSSGFIGSREVGRFFPLYGRFEIRARVPHGQGLWPAFWLRHVDGAGSAEVDILEVFHSQRPGDVTQTLHFPDHLGTNAWSRSTALEAPVVGTGDWHDFAVEILPEPGGGVRFRFFVDEIETGSFVDTEAPWRDGADPENTWDIAVNLAVGGRWVGEPEADLGWLPLLGICSLDLATAADAAGCPADGLHLASFPSVYEVDHVRVWVPRPTQA